MYNAINTRWTAKYGTGIGRSDIYRSDLLNLDGSITFSTSLTDVYTNNGSTLFNYLPNITGLSFANCTQLTSIYTM
jgi:hypothetical protein